MKELVCSQHPDEHGGRVVFGDRKSYYCDECNCLMLPKENTDG